MKKVKTLPGDILKIKNSIGHKQVKCVITNATDNLIEQFTTNRDELDKLLGCTIIQLPSQSGFYSIDYKLRKATLIRLLKIEDTKFIKLNEHVFEVKVEQKGWTYA